MGRRLFPFSVSMQTADNTQREMWRVARGAMSELACCLDEWARIWYKIVAADPYGVRRESVQLKEPIPVLREIRSRRAGYAYMIGLPDVSNDYPPDSNGFSSKAFLAAQVEVQPTFNTKGLRKQAFFVGRT
jgi:hypothetical protein